MVVVAVSEHPLVQPGLYTQQTPPVIYLSGVLAFVAGLAIVRVHNLWRWNWETLVTLSGWGLLLLGLARMFGAVAYHRAVGTAESWVFMAVEGVLICVGLYLSFKAYTRSP
jgi:hypothetical protein